MSNSLGVSNLNSNCGCKSYWNTVNGINGNLVNSNQSAHVAHKIFNEKTKKTFCEKAAKSTLCSALEILNSKSLPELEVNALKVCAKAGYRTLHGKNYSY